MFDYKENCDTLEQDELLLNAGFTGNEVENLRKLRQKFLERGRCEVLGLADYRRLEFARWLVQNGRISDQVA